MGPANDNGAATVDDAWANLIAELEILQRTAWAIELGLDPDAVDLLALPPAEVVRRAA